MRRAGEQNLSAPGDATRARRGEGRREPAHRRGGGQRRVAAARQPADAPDQTEQLARAHRDQSPGAEVPAALPKERRRRRDARAVQVRPHPRGRSVLRRRHPTKIPRPVEEVVAGVGRGPSHAATRHRVARGAAPEGWGPAGLQHVLAESPGGRGRRRGAAETGQRRVAARGRQRRARGLEA